MLETTTKLSSLYLEMNQMQRLILSKSMQQEACDLLVEQSILVDIICHLVFYQIETILNKYH